MGKADRGVLCPDWGVQCATGGVIYVSVKDDSPDSVEFPVVYDLSKYVDQLEKFRTGTSRAAFPDSISVAGHRFASRNPANNSSVFTAAGHRSDDTYD